MIHFYDNEYYNDNDSINFQGAYPNFRQVLNHDSTPRWGRGNNSSTNNVENSSTDDANFQNRLMTIINPLLGEKYSNSRRLEKGYADCSGFVNKVYKQLGMDLKGAASSQLWQMGQAINLDQIKPGDLAFLTSTGNKKVAGQIRKPGQTSHVAVVLERQGTKIKVAEATGSQGTVIQWWEIGDPKKRETGVVNYADGSGRRDKFFGFRRLLN